MKTSKLRTLARENRRVAESEHGSVPRDVANPFAWLLENGWTSASLAVEWKLRNGSSVERYKARRNPPSYKTIGLIAGTFGWTPGEVLDWFKAHVEDE